MRGTRGRSGLVEVRLSLSPQSILCILFTILFIVTGLVILSALIAFFFIKRPSHDRMASSIDGAGVWCTDENVLCEY